MNISKQRTPSSNKFWWRRAPKNQTSAIFCILSHMALQLLSQNLFMNFFRPQRDKKHCLQWTKWIIECFYSNRSVRWTPGFNNDGNEVFPYFLRFCFFPRFFFNFQMKNLRLCHDVLACRHRIDDLLLCFLIRDHQLVQIVRREELSEGERFCCRNGLLVQYNLKTGMFRRFARKTRVFHLLYNRLSEFPLSTSDMALFPSCLDEEQMWGTLRFRPVDFGNWKKKKRFQYAKN